MWRRELLEQRDPESCAESWNPIGLLFLSKGGLILLSASAFPVTRPLTASVVDNVQVEVWQVSKPIPDPSASGPAFAAPGGALRKGRPFVFRAWAFPVKMMGKFPGASPASS